MSVRLVNRSFRYIRQARSAHQVFQQHRSPHISQECIKPNLKQRQVISIQDIRRLSTSKALYEGDARPLMEIKFDELRDLLKSKSVVLVDVREPKELVEDGKILGSINVPLGEVESALALSPDKFESKYGGRLPTLDDSNKLVVSCRSGKRAAMALEKAKKQGYENARCYSGSFQDWQANGGPLEK